MSCRVWEELGSAALDGAVSAEEHKALEAHRALCRDCAEQLGEMAALRGLLGSLSGDDSPAGFDQELFAQLDADRSGPVGRAARALFALLPRRSLVPSAGAAALLVTIALMQEPPSSLVAGAPPPSTPATGATASPGLVTGSTATNEAGLEFSPPEQFPTAGLLTVWDTSAETIIASIDPAGLAGVDPMGGHARRADFLLEPRVGKRTLIRKPRAQVRIFLFERIVVKG